MTYADKDDLHALLTLLCEHSLDDADTRRLNELLRTDADARRIYLEYLDVHSRLLSQPQLLDALPPGRRDAPSGVRKYVPYVLTAVAAGAVCLAVQAYWTAAADGTAALPAAAQPSTNAAVPAAPSPRPASVAAANSTRTMPYVATLIAADDSIWVDGKARPVGSRLTIGRLSLKQGKISLHFDVGPELALEGPAELTIDRVNSATLQSGRALFRNHDGPTNFRLYTPLSQVIDVGTQYALAVDDRGEELHVFDGEVVRIPKVVSPQSVRIAAGNALRFDSAADEGRPVSLDENRKDVVSTEKPDATDEVMRLAAYEDFEQPIAKPWNRSSRPVTTHDFGWVSPWRSQPERPESELRRTFGLSRMDRQRDSETGALLAASDVLIRRELEQPISLDVDGVLYFSFLARAEKFIPGAPCELTFALDNAEATAAAVAQRDFSLSIAWQDGSAALGWEPFSTSVSLPIEMMRSYLITGKIVTSAENSDQAFVRIICPQRIVSFAEPTRWGLVGRPLSSTGKWDTVSFRMRTSTAVMVDELRIGPTWASVIAPYASPSPTEVSRVE